MDDYDPRDDLPPKEEPDCPSCCDSGWQGRRPCRSCRPSWLALRWSVVRWWIRAWRLRRAGASSDEPPF